MGACSVVVTGLRIYMYMYSTSTCHYYVYYYVYLLNAIITCTVYCSTTKPCTTCRECFEKEKQNGEREKKQKKTLPLASLKSPVLLTPLSPPTQITSIVPVPKAPYRSLPKQLFFWGGGSSIF